MKAIIHHSRRPFLVLIALALLIGVCATAVGTVNALDQGGGTSTSGGCRNTYNICTDNGFGWTLYHTDGSVGKPDFFKVDNWNTVSSICSYAGGVYIFEVGGKPKGGGKVYTQAYPMNIIWYGGYYPGGAYWNAHYRGDDYNLVHNRYLTNLGSSPNRWDGDNHSLEWFCYDINPKWNIGVSTSASINGSAANSGNQTAEVGDTITWRHTVTNNGPSQTNQTVNYSANNKQDLTGGSPGSWSMGPGGSSSSNTSPPYTVKASDFGKNLCRSTSASPINQSGGSAETPDVCVRIVKKPKVQILGGDLSVGRPFSGSSPMTSLIITSQSVNGGKTYGSWGEYALAASGAIQGPASGAGLKDGVAVSSPCQYSLLTVANATGSACTPTTSLGNYRTNQTIPDVAGQFPITSATPTFGDLSDAQYKRVEKATSTVNIGGGTIAKGQWLVINAPGQTVNITGDINYDNGPFQAISDIPQLIIIANTINIAGGVGTVNAWLIANGSSGTINTCSDVAAGGKLSGQVCGGHLQVNGPVMAKHIYLQRTAGADANGVGNPAETFNLRADAYLWGQAQSLQGLHVNVAATTELPPRF